MSTQGDTKSINIDAIIAKLTLLGYNITAVSSWVYRYNKPGTQGLGAILHGEYTKVLKPIYSTIAAGKSLAVCRILGRDGLADTYGRYSNVNITEKFKSIETMLFRSSVDDIVSIVNRNTGSLYIADGFGRRKKLCTLPRTSNLIPQFAEVDTGVIMLSMLVSTNYLEDTGSHIFLIKNGLKYKEISLNELYHPELISKNGWK